jgi:hypothetical protein
MKKLTSFVVAMLLGIAPVFASDSGLKKTWEDFRSNSHVHLFDNLTPAGFYDTDADEFLAGAVTSLYSYRFLTLDVGIVEDFPIAGANVKVNELLMYVPQIRETLTFLKLDEGFLKYTAMGLWAARDFEAKKARYGYYVGAEFQF